MVPSVKRDIHRNHAFSGEHSSRAVKAEPYSICFAKHVSELKAFVPNEAEISLMVYMKKIIPEAILALETRNIEPTFFHGVRLTNQVNSTNEWKKFSVSLHFPKPINDSSQIKIYVWNPTDYPIFIDDLCIEFSDRDVQ